MDVSTIASFLQGVLGDAPDILSYGYYGLVGLVITMYVSGQRDHFHHEHAIKEKYFSKTKEYLSDVLEHVYEVSVTRAHTLLREKYNQQKSSCVDGNECHNSDYIKELKLQKEYTEFQRILEQALYNKLYKKIQGWLRENGFHDSPQHDVFEYCRTRGKQALKSCQDHIEARIRISCPSLVGTKELRFTEAEAIESMSDLISFAIRSHNSAVDEIKEYRKKSNILSFFPSRKE